MKNSLLRVTDVSTTITNRDYIQRSPRHYSIPNQLTFKLDYEHVKKDILDLDTQIGQEIDLMLGQLEELDTLKQKKNVENGKLNVAKTKLKSVCSETTWTSVRTSVELAETMLSHTQVEHKRQRKNCETMTMNHTDQCEKLRRTEKKFKDTTEKNAVSRREIEHNAQLFHNSKTLDLIEKDDTLQKLRNLITDCKIVLQERRVELKMELQRIQTDCNLARKELEQSKQECSDVRAEKPNLENQIQEKIWQQEEALSEMQATHRRKKESHKEVFKNLESRCAQTQYAQLTGLMKEIDRKMEKLNSAEKAAASLTKSHRCLSRSEEDAEDKIRTLQTASCKLERKLTQKGEYFEHEYQSQERKCLHAVAKNEADVDELIEQVSAQEAEIAKMIKEKFELQASVKQIYADEKEAVKMISSVIDRIKEQKDRAKTDQQLCQNVCSWKRKILDVGITPHCYMERLRQQMQNLNTRLDQFQKQRAC